MNISPVFPTVPTTAVLTAARSLWNWSGVFIAAVLAATAQAQQVIMPPPQQTLVAPNLREAVRDVSSASPEDVTRNLGPVFAMGGFQLRPHLFASYVHADGLPVQDGSRVASNILTFAPGLLADLGTHWTLDYTATAHNYSSSDFRNAVDQDFRLTGANKSPDWILQVTEGYSVTSPILIETAQQTEQKNWTNSFSAEHNFGNLLHYQGTIGLNVMQSENYPETRGWETEQWIRATVSPRVAAGFGLGLGYSDIVGRPNTYFEKYVGDLTWRPTARIDLALEAGWENWHSTSDTIGSKRFPTLQTTLGYRPFEQTRISFTDQRTIANSVGGDSLTEGHAWGAALNQRLFGKLFLRLSYNHDSTEYRALAGNPLAGRTDHVESFNSALSVILFRYWSVAATYQTSKNDSSKAGYRYDSSQYGLELRANF